VGALESDQRGVSDPVVALSAHGQYLTFQVNDRRILVAHFLHFQNRQQFDFICVLVESKCISEAVVLVGWTTADSHESASVYLRHGCYFAHRVLLLNCVCHVDPVLIWQVDAVEFACGFLVLVAAVTGLHVQFVLNGSALHVLAQLGLTQVVLCVDCLDGEHRGVYFKELVESLAETLRRDSWGKHTKYAWRELIAQVVVYFHLAHI